MYYRTDRSHSQYEGQQMNDCLEIALRWNEGEGPEQELSGAMLSGAAK